MCEHQELTIRMRFDLVCATNSHKKLKARSDLRNGQPESYERKEKESFHFCIHLEVKSQVFMFYISGARSIRVLFFSQMSSLHPMNKLSHTHKVYTRNALYDLITEVKENRILVYELRII